MNIDDIPEGRDPVNDTFRINNLQNFFNNLSRDEGLKFISILKNHFPEQSCDIDSALSKYIKEDKV